MTVFDVIVVGAGPGGSNAAAVALRHGLSVAQVDKSRFPRVKPCGGGLTIKSCRALQFDLQPMLRGESREFEFNVLHRCTNQFAHLRSAVLRMVDRPQFDNWLVSENLKAPRFRFFEDERVLDISYDGLFQVRTSKRLLQGRHLVGADGAYSLVNRLFSITQPLGFAVAVEVTLRRDRATLPAETPPCFDFGAVESGYGWVFPKDDHWNVGLYTLNKSRHLREQLAAYIAVKGFRIEGDPLATFAGHQFPYGGYRITLPEAPVYIVGDAGGFGDPIVGEGIYQALESGRIAWRDDSRLPGGHSPAPGVLPAPRGIGPGGHQGHPPYRTSSVSRRRQGNDDPGESDGVATGGAGKCRRRHVYGDHQEERMVPAEIIGPPLGAIPPRGRQSAGVPGRPTQGTKVCGDRSMKRS